MSLRQHRQLMFHLDEVLAIFGRHGFDAAAVIGSVGAASAAPRLSVR